MHDPLVHQKQLERWLLEEGLVSAAELEDARGRQRHEGTELGITLLEQGVLAEADLVDLLSRKHNLPKAPHRLHRQPVPARALSAIPEDMCWQYNVFPFGVDLGASRLQVAVADPADAEVHEMLDNLGALEPELFVVGPRALEKAIRKHYMDAWVDDSRGGRARFFGYENMTNPGGLLPGAMPAAPPAPTRMRPDQPTTGGVSAGHPAVAPLPAGMALVGTPPPGLPPVRPPMADSHSVRPTDVQPAVFVPPGRQPEAHVPGPTPLQEPDSGGGQDVVSVPSAVGRLRPTVSRAELDQRLQRVERALSSLCATLASDADGALQADLQRILSYLAGDDD